MNLAPLDAQVRQSFAERCLNPAHFGLRKTVVLSQFWRLLWTVQVEHGLTAFAYDVDVRGAMIVGIDHPRSLSTRSTVGILSKT
jgi:hypothetical protein